MLHLVTDSTSDLLADGAREMGVTVVPLTVRFGEEQLRDGVDIDATTFYRRLTTAPTLPTTSQPSPEQFAELYRSLLVSPADQVVSVHLPAQLSGTWQSARLAARDFDEGRVHVVDSGTVSAWPRASATRGWMRPRLSATWRRGATASPATCCSTPSPICTRAAASAAPRRFSAACST
jgi:DegV family protein with EDD domain